MTTMRNIARAIFVVAFLAAGLIACDSPKPDAAADKSATSTPAVEEEPAVEEKVEEKQAGEEEQVAEEAKEPSTEAPSPGGTEESAKRKDIRKLLEITGSAKLGIQVANQVLNQLKTTAPDVPEEFWEEFRKDMSEQGLIELIVPIYDKNLTHEEIKALITFFETPAGKSYVQKLPVIMRESQLAGQKWGREIAMKAQKRLQAKGYR